MNRRWSALSRGIAVGVLTVGLLGSADPVVAQDSAQDPAGPEAEVLAVVRTLFDGMRERNEEKLGSVFHPEARLHTAGGGGSGTPIESFIQSILSGESYLDEVTFDDVVLVNGPLAVAWTPYNLFVDDRFSHCGVDAFTLVRSAEGWKILQIVDTRVRTGCDPSRRG